MSESRSHYQDQVERCCQEIQRLTGQYEADRTAFQDAESRCRDRQQELDAVEAELNEISRDQEQNSERREQKEKERKTARARLDEAKAEQNALANKLASGKQRLAQVLAEAATLRADLKTMRTTECRAAAELSAQATDKAHHKAAARREEAGAFCLGLIDRLSNAIEEASAKIKTLKKNSTAVRTPGRGAGRPFDSPPPVISISDEGFGSAGGGFLDRYGRIGGGVTGAPGPPIDEMSRKRMVTDHSNTGGIQGQPMDGWGSMPIGGPIAVFGEQENGFSAFGEIPSTDLGQAYPETTDGGFGNMPASSWFDHQQRTDGSIVDYEGASGGPQFWGSSGFNSEGTMVGDHADDGQPAAWPEMNRPESHFSAFGEIPSTDLGQAYPETTNEGFGNMPPSYVFDHQQRTGGLIVEYEGARGWPEFWVNPRINSEGTMVGDHVEGGHPASWSEARRTESLENIIKFETHTQPHVHMGVPVTSKPDGTAWFDHHYPGVQTDFTGTPQTMNGGFDHPGIHQSHDAILGQTFNGPDVLGGSEFGQPTSAFDGGGSAYGGLEGLINATPVGGSFGDFAGGTTASGGGGLESIVDSSFSAYSDFGGYSAGSGLPSFGAGPTGFGGVPISGSMGDGAGVGPGGSFSGGLGGPGGSFSGGFGGPGGPGGGGPGGGGF
jgi:hypothetical protein